MNIETQEPKERDDMKTTIINKGLRVGVCAVVAASLAIGSVAALSPAAAQAEEPSSTAEAVASGPVPVQYKTLAGEDAYDTMAAIQKDIFAQGTCDTVIVASGGAYYDALAASGLAGALSAATGKEVPVLICEKDTLSLQTTAAIAHTGAKNIIIAGGPMALSDDVEAALKALSGITDVSRVYGTNATDTAVAVNEMAALDGKISDTAIVASSANFADALSVASYAYAKGAPIYLTEDKDTLSPDAAAALAKYKNIRIVGGTAVVGKDLEGALAAKAAVVRWAGNTLYQTSIKIAEGAVAEGVLSYDTVFVATGKNYYDALSSSAAVGSLKSPLILLDDNTDGALGISAVLDKNKSAIKAINFLGGYLAVTPNTIAAIKDTLKVWIPNLVEVVVDDFEDVWTAEYIWGATAKEWHALEEQGHTLKCIGDFCTHCKFLVLDSAYDPATCNTPTWDWEAPGHGGAGAWAQDVVVGHYQAPENKACLAGDPNYTNRSDTYIEMDGHFEQQKVGSHTETIDKGHWE